MLRVGGFICWPSVWFGVLTLFIANPVLPPLNAVLFLWRLDLCHVAGGGNEELGQRGLLQPARRKNSPFPLATVIGSGLGGHNHLANSGTSQSQFLCPSISPLVSCSVSVRRLSTNGRPLSSPAWSFTAALAFAPGDDCQQCYKWRKVSQFQAANLVASRRWSAGGTGRGNRKGAERCRLKIIAIALRKVIIDTQTWRPEPKAYWPFLAWTFGISWGSWLASAFLQGIPVISQLLTIAGVLARP